MKSLSSCFVQQTHLCSEKIFTQQTSQHQHIQRRDLTHIIRTSSSYTSPIQSFFSPFQKKERFFFEAYKITGRWWHMVSGRGEFMKSYKMKIKMLQIVKYKQINIYRLFIDTTQIMQCRPYWNLLSIYWTIFFYPKWYPSFPWHFIVGSFNHFVFGKIQCFLFRLNILETKWNKD